jgi:hypothetical protein
VIIRTKKWKGNGGFSTLVETFVNYYSITTFIGVIISGREASAGPMPHRLQAGTFFPPRCNPRLQFDPNFRFSSIPLLPPRKAFPSSVRIYFHL